MGGYFPFLGYTPGYTVFKQSCLYGRGRIQTSPTYIIMISNNNACAQYKQMSMAHVHADDLYYVHGWTFIRDDQATS